MNPLLVDLYELTMGESYLAEGLDEQPATFQLFCRTLPFDFGYLIAAGIRYTIIDDRWPGVVGAAPRWLPVPRERFT